MRLNDECDRQFGLQSCPRWDYDLDRGTLTFSKDGIPRVVASIFVVGTTSSTAGNWLWSWANGHLPDNVSEAMKKVRDFGACENVADLTEPYLADDEHLGREMTANAARVMDAKGAYRAPGDNGFMYMIYQDIYFADLPRKYESRGQITCASHGSAYQAFVCEHLIAKPAQPWFSSEPNEEDPWPDAWCATCEKFFQEHGEWGELNEKDVNIQLLCHFCYERLRAQAS